MYGASVTKTKIQKGGHVMVAMQRVKLLFRFQVTIHSNNLFQPFLKETKNGVQRRATRLTVK